jgi:hypothetical protein
MKKLVLCMLSTCRLTLPELLISSDKAFFGSNKNMRIYPGSNTGSASKFPKLNDQYFFKNGSNPMPRTIADVRKMVQSLNVLGLLTSILEELIPSFDELHTEYLLQIIWDRIGNKDPSPTTVLQDFNLDYPMVNGASVTKSTRCLHKQLRRHQGELKESQRTVSSVVQSRIEKHWYNKPKVKGLGNTSCILTDVMGFRDVLHSALVFHALNMNFMNWTPNSIQTCPSSRPSWTSLC